MSIVQEVIGEDRRLTVDLARFYERVRAWRERWGWSPLSSEAYDPPPPYSLPCTLPTLSPRASSAPENTNLWPNRQSVSPAPDPIPNPIIPGDPALSADILSDQINAFARSNGFRIVRRNQYSYKGRLIRCSFQCDRFGKPRDSESCGLRDQRSRKCGCEWKITAEALE